jgi:hypothetical protein
MRVFIYLAGIGIYLAALTYLVLGTLGFGFGLRISGNTFVDEGFGLQKTSCLLLLGVLVGFGLYCFWRLNRRSV